MSRRLPPEADPAQYLELGEVAHAEPLCMQSQYAARYLDGRIQGYPNLGDVEPPIRWAGDTANYHDILIHKDDAEAFRRRVVAHLVQTGERRS